VTQSFTEKTQRTTEGLSIRFRVLCLPRKYTLRVTSCFLCETLCNNSDNYRVAPALSLNPQSVLRHKNFQRPRQHFDLENSILSHRLPIRMKRHRLIYFKPDTFRFHCLA